MSRKADWLARWAVANGKTKEHARELAWDAACLNRLLAYWPLMVNYIDDNY